MMEENLVCLMPLADIRESKKGDPRHMLIKDIYQKQT